MKKKKIPEKTLFPVKRILCPTDLSEPSYAGISAAVAIAENQMAELILIHVVIPVYHGSSTLIPLGFDAREYYDEMKEIARNNLEEHIKRQIPKELNVRILIKEGNAPDEIIKTSEKEEVDLIVIATHGWTGWRRFMFGSVAERVVRLSTRPVITIPEPQ